MTSSLVGYIDMQLNVVLVYKFITYLFVKNGFSSELRLSLAPQPARHTESAHKCAQLEQKSTTKNKNSMKYIKPAINLSKTSTFYFATYKKIILRF